MKVSVSFDRVRRISSVTTSRRGSVVVDCCDLEKMRVGFTRQSLR